MDNTEFTVLLFFFIWRKERERTQAGERGRGRDEENLKQGPRSTQSLMQGLDPTTLGP